MKRLLEASCAAALLVAAAGCSPIYYAPNTHNVPMLQGKGDGTFGVHGANNGGDIQGAYAFTDHIALMVNVASMKQRDDKDGDGGSGSLFEAGIGYQRNLPGALVWENYFQLGGGSVENHFPSTVAGNPGTTGNLEAKFTKFGYQPSISVHSRLFDAAVSLRLSSLKYSDVSGSLIHDGVDQRAYLEGLGSQFLVEPAFTLRAGWDPIKLQLQLGFSKNVTTDSFGKHMREGYLALGILYQLRRDRSGPVRTP